jgi:hypothetical protein
MHFEECARWNARVVVIGGEIWRSVGVATQALFGVGSKEFSVECWCRFAFD